MKGSCRVVDRLYIPTKSMLDTQQRLVEGCECSKDAKDLLTCAPCSYIYISPYTFASASSLLQAGS